MSRTDHQQLIVTGSPQDLAQREGVPISDIIRRMQHILLIDVSGSMADKDARDNLARIEVAEQEMDSLQRQAPGRYGIFYFSTTAGYCPSGRPPHEFGGTNMLLGLQTVQPYDGLVTTITVISDGEPNGGRNGQEQIVALAKTFTTPISTVYIGPRHGAGQTFLTELAKAGNGRGLTAHEAKQLAQSVQLLISAKSS